MTKAEYITNQFHRTHNKKYENYCILGIWHRLNRTDVQFVTQQMFRRNNGIALADLYLPQLNMYIEIDESHHAKQTIEDKLRTEEIIKNKIKKMDEIIDGDIEEYRIDVSHEDIDLINQRIDEVVKIIKDKIVLLGENFVPWNNEYPDPEVYIKKDILNVSDNVKVHTLFDVSKLFHKGYRGNQKCYFDSNDKSIKVWCPKLTEDKELKGIPYLNTISPDKEYIYECAKPDNKKYNRFVAETETKINEKRTVFAYYLDSAGNHMYKFMGLYEMDKKSLKNPNKRIWKRYSQEIKLSDYK